MITIPERHGQTDRRLAVAILRSHTLTNICLVMAVYHNKMQY